ncbi:MAG TPA: CheR family methyltransferase [Deltaproteobacteria bacterium]|nr:CheR family methyltransferase [Deltaproteobacteria bacterium]HOM28707.1 CheR family methyltransferase [Deltaproteobacteria bacterium]HPP80468.1 CheR family methyltransferase [Deltaproteobacteria bacterium]
MNALPRTTCTTGTVSLDVFERLSSLIMSELGIKMPPSKKTMLEARLAKRMRDLNIDDLGEYVRFLFTPEGTSRELPHMLDAVTTNKTDFFREPQHFTYLAEHAVPTLVASTGAGMRRPLMVWSAACSSGEEAYTLAMVLKEYATHHPGFRFMVLGTDVSNRMIETARLAIYQDTRAEPIPLHLREKYLLKSKDRSKKLVRIAPEIRSVVRFRRLNFLEEDYQLREKMDVIFCRNVLIYFERATQEKVLRHLCEHLAHGGYMFTGHSETISGMNLPLRSVSGTVSRRT